MPYIQIELDDPTDQLFEAVAKKERRSKREQVAHMAIERARMILPNFKPTAPKAKKRGGAK